jgi:hypothetical protein
VTVKVGSSAASRPLCIPSIDCFSEPASVSAGQTIRLRQVVPLQGIWRNTHSRSEFRETQVPNRRHKPKSNPLTTPLRTGIVGVWTTDRSLPTT